MADDYSLQMPDAVEPEPSEVSGTPNVNYADLLDCTEMRPRVWYLDG